jgi:hypothetical protein
MRHSAALSSNAPLARNCANSAVSPTLATPQVGFELSATKWLHVRADFAILIRNQEVAYEQ